MSLLPLSFYTKYAISMFSQVLVTQDVVYSTVSGVDTQGTVTSRNINAAVDPQSGKRLEQIFGGSVTDGSIGIYTADTLYFLDLYASGSVRKQSFVTYQGIQYKVLQDADWRVQAGVSVYLAERHVTQATI